MFVLMFFAYVARTELPSIVPPSYRGATIRYFYYVDVHYLEDGWFWKMEARIPLQIWVTQKTSGLLIEEGHNDGIVPNTAIQMDVYWKEMDGDSDWVRANETYDGVEEGYESSRDEVSSVSSYNPMKENIHKSFGSSLSLHSFSARSSTPYLEGERTSISSYVALPRLSVAEVINDSSLDALSSQKSSANLSPSEQRKDTKPISADDEAGVSTIPGTDDPAASEGFIRGRSYNIRLDDQVLLRFSQRTLTQPIISIGGTLTFFHEEGARRCLEVSITLESSETVNRRFAHPSRRNSLTITKVDSLNLSHDTDMVE
ncbi:hypothetical protein CK203_035794 [Vitis vinifera]|uniref:Uncharacterized protein n=1 Tax=Vitis vinifera TaxID=29760 RepID=A0A438FYW4_VITVI|nr:hypothetical protein CK203_035794 [Vitis vinifera]